LRRGNLLIRTTITHQNILLKMRLPRRHKHASKRETLNKAPRNDGNEKHPPFKCEIATSP
jgi:hypothetical protein